MPHFSLIYGNFARFDRRMLAIPGISLEEYEQTVLNRRVLMRMFDAAQSLDEIAHGTGDYYTPTIFTAQLLGQVAEHVSLIESGSDRGIVENRRHVHGIVSGYWASIERRGLKPVINTTITPWEPIVAAPSPDFTLLGIKFPRR